ncbi:hypothetical protein [Winogradskyella sp.]
MPPGAPHYHSYQSKTNNIKVEVFCTAGKKRYHLFYDDYANVEVCSKVFGKDDCFIFKRDSFFKQMKYQKTIRIGDVKFHKLFKKDTLKVSLINSGKVFELFPVE